MGQDLNELFDVVDDRDEVVGQAPRHEVHARGLKHRAVHILVINREGKVFLHQRSMFKDLFPGAWDSSCAGHVGAGEDYDATARRELEEELGCRPEQPPVRLFKLPAQPATGWEFVWVYAVRADGPFTLQADEIDHGDWFTPEEIDRWLAVRAHEFAPAVPLFWPQARARLAQLDAER
jgi:isopentenyl-diphosphate Delta-isomerase